MGGQASRMAKLTRFFSHELGHDISGDDEPYNYASGTDRYALYKAGPVLFASHGMGNPSLSIVLHELFKLLFHARCSDVTFIRVGTCGGIGLEPGTVVISEAAVDGKLRPVYEAIVLGKVHERPAKVDKALIESLYECREESDSFKTVLGTTLCCDDFYEGQGRLDGSVCEYTEKDKLAYLHHLKEKGVTNIEMESVGFYAMCHKVGIKAAVLCVILVDRLQGDEPPNDKNLLTEWQKHPLIIVARYMKKKLGIDNPDMIE